MTVTRTGRAAAFGLVAGLLLLLSAILAFQRESPQAEAADSETAALIGYMNNYRAQFGAPALTAGVQINADAQSVATAVAEGCNYGPMYSTGYDLTFGSYSYPSASSLWSAWQADPVYLSYIRDPSYRSVGVGRGYGNCFNPMWVVLMSRSGGGPTLPPPSTTSTPTPSPSRTPSPTPSRTPTPTPSMTPSPTPTHPPLTPTPTPTPSGTPMATPSPPVTVTPTSSTNVTLPPTATPTATPEPTGVKVHGDADCDGQVNAWDGLLVLRRAARIAVAAPCLDSDGVDCLGVVDTMDALAVFQFIGGIQPDLPSGCPLLGEQILRPPPTGPPTGTFTLTPTPVVTPTPVPTPTQSSSPAATPTSPTLGPGINHCFLAILSYEVVNAPVFAGLTSCSAASGTPYSCDFPALYNDAYCTPQSSGRPSYECYVYQREWAWCDASSGPDYQCSNNTGATDCFPIGGTGPEYFCTLDTTTVSCLTEDAAPHFSCTREGQTFACAPLD